MGTDIHMHYERRQRDCEATPRWRRIDWDEPFRTKTPNDDGYRGIVDWEGFFASPLWIERNYQLFALLANVRNGFGFAGADTGDPIRPIAPCRGIPEDAAPETASEANSWGQDAHSASYYTLGELLAYDWTSQEVVRRGYVDLLSYRTYKEGGRRPPEWCGDISGGSVIKVTNKTMDHYLLHPDESPGKAYTQVEWTDNLGDCIGSFLETLGALTKFAEGEHEDVRLVFWFDN